MLVIDCHQHFWVWGKRAHKFPPAAGRRLDRDFTPADLRPQLKKNGVDGTILVQSLNDLDETYEFLDLSRAIDYVLGVVGWVPLTNPTACATALESVKSHGKLIGVRPLIAYEPDPNWLLQTNVRESLGSLAKADLVFEAIPVNERQFDAVLKVARAMPELKVVLNHLGNPPVPEQGWQPWATYIKHAAELPNMSIKLSAGLALVIRWKWSTEEIRRYADYVIEMFGPERVMAGSNWPVVELGGTFERVWNGLTDLVEGLTPAERAAVFGGSAQRIYRL
jgi:L-fuconolactonase